MFIPRNNYGFDLFDDFFNDSFWTGSQPSQTKKDTGLMRTDILDGGSCYLVDIELPGYRKDEIQAELKDGYLTISASTNSNKDEKDGNGRYIRRERYSGSCSRSFYVGDAVTEQDIKAKFEDGTLKMLVPKAENRPAVEDKKYIPIEG